MRVIASASRNKLQPSNDLRANPGPQKRGRRGRGLETRSAAPVITGDKAMNTPALPETLSVVDPRVADLLEDMREARWTVEDTASDMHRQADLLARAFRQLERSLKQLISPPPSERS